MQAILKEGIDFEWLTKETPFGTITTNPKTNNGIELKRITNPMSHGVVLLSVNDCLKPVRVHSGEYESNGRISNFWSWYTLDDPNNKKLEQGYGFFYETPTA